MKWITSEPYVRTATIKPLVTVDHQMGRKVNWRAGCVERRTSGSEGRIWETHLLQDRKERPVLTLHLIYFPTLIYAEIVFYLSTMMQAAARSYRLNQTHPHCKTIYLYYEETMEHTAVQLMSRKQRAAKLLTGDIGLTGLDSLTEGEGGFESALLDAIGKDESLLDPAEMFKQDVTEDEISAEDAAFWNVEEGEVEVVVEPEAVVEVKPVQQTVEWDDEPEAYEQLSLWG